MSNRGKRYDSEPKLNYKKVIGVIVAIAVIIMIIISIINIVKTGKQKIEVKKYSYYVSYENGKFGVIDNEGNNIIEPSYDEMISIPNSSKPIFICVYDINEADGTYKTKAINDKNEEILAGYDKIEALDNYDSKQNIWYEDNVLKVSKNGKYGIIDFEGKEVLPCDYDEITALNGVKSNILVKKAGNIGLVNEKGQTIVPVQYKNVLTLKEGYKNEYIVVNENDQYGLINTSGVVVIEPKYEMVKYLNSSSMFAIKEAGVWKVIDIGNGNIVIDGGYDDIIQAKTDSFVIVKNGKIIARGYNQKETKTDTTKHAEIIAIQKASKKLKAWRLLECEMYVTLEPCSMCAGAIINSRIKKVYYGTSDNKTGAVGSVLNLFEDFTFNHKVEYEKNIMQTECENILKQFFKELRKNKNV